MPWSVHIAHGHGERIAAMPDEFRNGRNLRDGYTRACGIQFGNVRQLCEADTLYRRAYALAKSRTIVSPANFMNLFLIVAFGFRKLPPGDIVEFGSHQGGSAIFLAIRRRGSVSRDKGLRLRQLRRNAGG